MSFFIHIAEGEHPEPYATTVSVIVNACLILAALSPRETWVVVSNLWAAIPIYRAAREIFPPGGETPAEVGELPSRLILKLESCGFEVLPF
jgi:hypothetical protein